MVQASVCTVCGARQPLVAGLQEGAVRDAWAGILAVAYGQESAEAIAAYVDWFAPPEKALQARTVARVLADLTARIGSGEVRAKGIARPAPLSAWIEAMRLIVGGHTEATRPLPSNGYLAGIVWRRAGEPRAPQVPAPAPRPEAVEDPPRRGLARAHLLGELSGLRTMLAGANTPSAQESLRRQIAEVESRLKPPAGVDDESRT